VGWKEEKEGGDVREQVKVYADILSIEQEKRKKVKTDGKRMFKSSVKKKKKGQIARPLLLGKEPTGGRELRQNRVPLNLKTTKRISRSEGQERGRKKEGRMSTRGKKGGGRRKFSRMEERGGEEKGITNCSGNAAEKAGVNSLILRTNEKREAE